MHQKPASIARDEKIKRRNCESQRIGKISQVVESTRVVQRGMAREREEIKKERQTLVTA